MTKLSISTTRVKFGDVAINSTAVSADPEAEGFDRYIIGKHIPEDADRIETWGPVGDSDFGPRIRTIFQPGDVICTTRGPKLKVARVDFKGLGAHTNFYLRTADPEVLLQPYLEAVVRSNGFQQHLVNNFRGSVNLFVNWSDAAKYEFALPPLEEQRRIALALQACAQANESFLVTMNTFAEVCEAKLQALFSGASRGALSGFAEKVTKGTTPTSIGYDYVQDGIPFLRAEDVLNREVNVTSCEKHIGADAHQALRRSQIFPNDVLVTIAGTVGRVGLVPAGIGQANCNQAVAIIRPTDPRDARFLFTWLMTPDARKQMLGGKVTGTISNLSLTSIKNLHVPMLKPEQRVRVSREFEVLVNSRKVIEDRAGELRKIQRSILHRSFQTEVAQ